MKTEIGKKSAVICLAAGKSQLPIILKAKLLGYKIIAIDKDKKAPGFRSADLKIYSSTYNADMIINKLKKFKSKFKFKGVLNRSSGLPVVTTAKICKYFKLPGYSIKSAKILVNKNNMRSALAKKNIPMPKYKTYSIKKYKGNNIKFFPVILKPCLSLKGKRGVTVVRSKNLIKKAILYAEKNTNNKKILKEEYLKGPDLSLISFINKKKLFPVCLLQEINIENKNGTISRKGYRTLKSNKHKWVQQANNIAKKIISKLEINNSAFIVSFRGDNDNNLKLIEVHLDIGGEKLIESFFPKALPFDFLKLAIEMIIDNPIFPTNFKVRPTAILFKGTYVSEGHKILTANSNRELDKKIFKYLE